MDIAIDYDEREDCCHVVITGTVFITDFQRAFRAAWASEHYCAAAAALWDFRDAQSRLHKDEIRALRELMHEDHEPSPARTASFAARELVDFTRRERPRRLPKRIAVVAASDLDFGMMRIYAGYATFDDVEMQIFKSRDAARGWLFAPG